MQFYKNCSNEFDKIKIYINNTNSGNCMSLKYEGSKVFSKNTHLAIENAKVCNL